MPPRFDSSSLQLKKGPGEISVDRELASRAPLASHPTRVMVRISMKAPAPDGLWSSRERPALEALEARIVQNLEPEGCIEVGRVVTAGIVDLYFYGPALLTDERTAAALDASARGYELEWGAGADPAWREYFEKLLRTNG